jgi:hypothetical protein
VRADIANHFHRSRSIFDDVDRVAQDGVVANDGRVEGNGRARPRMAQQSEMRTPASSGLVMVQAARFMRPPSSVDRRSSSIAARGCAGIGERKANPERAS